MFNPLTSNTVKYQKGNFNGVFVGNSLVAGTQASNLATTSLPARLQASSLLGGKVLINNQGVAGIPISVMIGNQATVVDAHYKTGYTNILFVFEGTNSICNAPIMTGLAAAQQMATYCQNVLAVHPDWQIILLTTIPRFVVSDQTVANANAELLNYNAYLLANYKAMGAIACVDVRAGGVFTCLPNDTTPNATLAPYMSSDLIHCNDAGYALLAKYCAQALSHLTVPRPVLSAGSTPTTPPANAPANSYNFNAATQFANYRTAKAALMAGTASVRIAFAGDSTTAGVGAAAHGYRLLSTSAQMVAHINTLQLSFKASFDNFLDCGNSLTADDTRITGYPNPAMTSGAQGAGGPAWQFAVGEGIDFTLATPRVFDRVRIAVIETSNGVCDVGVDGGALSGTTFIDDNSANILTKTYTVPLATHSVVNIRGTAGTTLLAMVECYNSQAPVLEVFNGGSGGADAQSMMGTSVGYGELPGILAAQPHLTFINYGINDGNSLNKTKALYKAQVLNGVQQLQAAGSDVILCVPTPIALGSAMETTIAPNLNPLWQDYRDALYEIALTQNVPVLNLHDRYVSYATQNAKNPSWMSDGLHPNALLYADLGAFLGDVVVGI